MGTDTEALRAAARALVLVRDALMAPGSSPISESAAWALLDEAAAAVRPVLEAS